ncbi:MAG: ribonuclease P protein component [Leptolyngbyaceae cyanobacterium SM1_1_3]|nr:ribonuclease P protein component [Leptolyngbyaceae cyanobacterium SM1_1_3]NJN03042.1 ribonuclease P protein component [Leptolyngbyaceae cyanobacterium RM1_1_2]NJO08721.1 ribonuclease P protein component [Leptolyngbyaceae cyanobacterium SL_1_1]
MALPKQHRLRHKKEFTAVYRYGDRSHSSHLGVRGLRLERGELAVQLPTRIGISISQKVSKRAVLRNRIKRQIGAALHQLLPRLSDGWWIVITVQPSAVECEYGQFLRELEDTLAKLEVIQ